jgi:prevent-host-death family protein
VGEDVNIFNIHEAKTQLSKLVEQAAAGESFIIAKAGTPLVRVSAISAPTSNEVRRLGFLRHQFVIPDNFNDIGSYEIAHLFGIE